VFQPAISGGAVFATGKDGEVTRIESGRTVWKTPLKTRVSGGVGSDGNLVAVGTPKGEVIALDAETGQVKWRVFINAEVLAAPAVSGGMVVVRSADSRLFGLDASDGKRRWTYQRATPALALQRGGVVGGQLHHRRLSGGKLVAVNGANGSLAWEGTVAVPRGATELERVADITSLPVMTPRATCAVAYQAGACFDMSNGTTLWTRDLSSSRGLDLDDRNVFVTDEKGAVHALDLANGASVWKQDQLAGQPRSSADRGDYTSRSATSKAMCIFSGKTTAASLAATASIPVRFSPTRKSRRRHRHPDTQWQPPGHRRAVKGSHRSVKPTLVLVGRPNVGKSTLFNRLTKTRDALVADFPA
jgi:outer membrane assembly lipoprotein YfgL